MSAVLLAAPLAPPGPARRFQHLLIRMTTRGRTIVRRLVARAEAPGVPAIASTLVPAVTGFTRFVRALRWVEALSQIFAGTWQPGAPRLPRPPRPASSPRPASQTRAAPPGALPPPAITSAMRRAFTTRPIGQIVGKLCHQLGIAPGSPAWPSELIALTVTPAEWATAQRAPADTARVVSDSTPELPKPTRQMRRWLAARARQSARHQRVSHRSARDPP